MANYAKTLDDILHNLSSLRSLERTLVRELAARKLTSAERRERIIILRRSAADLRVLAECAGTFRKLLYNELDGGSCPAPNSRELRGLTLQEIKALIDNAEPEQTSSADQISNPTTREQDIDEIERRYYAIANVRPMPPGFRYRHLLQSRPPRPTSS